MTHFCKLLTNQYHITYDDVKPCCWIQDHRIQIVNTNHIKKRIHDYAQITDWIPECSYCKTLENSGLESPRLMFNKSMILENDHVPGDAVKLEVQIDDDCNAACLMCSDWNSTTWTNYIEKTLKTKPMFFKNYTVEQRFQAMLDFVDFNKVRYLHFFGGEPLRTETHLRVLDKIPNPQLVSLTYVTNGSVAPSTEIIELWSKFKYVNIAISIDGTDDHFNYLRWPLQWSQVIENIKKFISIEHKNFRISTSFIITPLNILYQDRYVAWAKEFLKQATAECPQWFLNPNPSIGTINLECVPDELAAAVADKFGEKSSVYRLIQPFDSQKYQKFIEYVKFHDKHRNLDYTKTFPEVANLMPQITG